MLGLRAVKKLTFRDADDGRCVSALLPKLGRAFSPASRGRERRRRPLPSRLKLAPASRSPEHHLTADVPLHVDRRRWRPSWHPRVSSGGLACCVRHHGATSCGIGMPSVAFGSLKGHDGNTLCVVCGWTSTRSVRRLQEVIAHPTTVMSLSYTFRDVTSTFEVASDDTCLHSGERLFTA